MSSMKIGVFDSGVGGLLIAHSVMSKLPSYDYVYLGDTARVPYGNRSQTAVYECTEQAVTFLVNQGCGLIIIACNTASAEALRRLQQTFIPQHYPHIKVLGVLIPAAEAAVAATKNGQIGVLATTSTVSSGAFIREVHKLESHIAIVQQAAPLLVPLIENNAITWLDPILDDYLITLKEQKVDTLILGCTHYPSIKEQVRSAMGPYVTVVSQDEVVPEKLADYLQRHPEIESSLSRTKTQRYCVTDTSENLQALSHSFFGSTLPFELVDLE